MSPDCAKSTDDVAALITPKFESHANGAAPTDVWSVAQPNAPLLHVRYCPALHPPRPFTYNREVEAIVDANVVVVPLVNEKLVPLIAVVDAYGNCDAASVDDEKKTPCVRIDEVVAEVLVPNELSDVNGYGKVLMPRVAALRQLPPIAKQPAAMLKPTLEVEVA